MKKALKTGLIVLGGLLVLYCLLLIPESNSEPKVIAEQAPFEWNQQAVWEDLETQFQAARTMEPILLDSAVEQEVKEMDSLLTFIEDTLLLPQDPIFGQIEQHFFSLASLVAADQSYRSSLIDRYNRIRIAVKRISITWQMDEDPGRIRVYRLLYGMRGAVEEVLLANSEQGFDPAMQVENVPTATPEAEILGIKVHSGDLLASRGGAPASAFISRGNDFPGNFSHIAVLYVEETTNTPYLVEAHIERGVAISTVEEYVNDQKLRFMVLRPRSDLPEILADPLLPHKAAKHAYQEATTRHIPYDFKMDFHDDSEMFCSEVGSNAYAHFGVNLWTPVSTISSQGVVNWLSNFGVQNFVTQMPSDLEYDPTLAIVAEWRDPETLFKDHFDNAVIDVMLEGAIEGDEVDYAHWQLPIARMLKAYCWVLNQFGKVGKIPEGMSATAALRNQWFDARFAAIRSAAEPQITAFQEENGYRPPYWRLVEIIQEVESGEDGE